MLHRSCLQALRTEGIIRDSDYSEPSSSSGYCPAAGPFGRTAPPTSWNFPVAGTPVNSDRSFTGNCRSLAEYRVSTCRIALKIPPSNDDYHVLRRNA
jgi:hypothetical protein